MKRFYKKVDKRSRTEMVRFLTEHFRYNTMNSWNRSTSYAHNVKIYALHLPEKIEDILWQLIDDEDFYEQIYWKIDEFDRKYNYRWQIGFNGRSGGYLVLYKGGTKESEHKSYCQFCGQRNFTSIEETGNVCGRCGKPRRVDFEKPPVIVFKYPGQEVDMYEDFEDWSMEELKDRVELVQDFDRCVDEIVDEAVYLAECILNERKGE